MTIKINADTSDGLKFVSDTSGVIDLQTNGNHYHLRLRFECEYTSHNC